MSKITSNALTQKTPLVSAFKGNFIYDLRKRDLILDIDAFLTAIFTSIYIFSPSKKNILVVNLKTF